MRFPKIVQPPSVSTNTPQYNVTRTVSVLSSCKQQQRNVTSCNVSHKCNSKDSGLRSALMKLQLSAVTACTSVLRAHYSSPTKECGPPAVRNSSHFLQKTSNTQPFSLSLKGPPDRPFSHLLLSPISTLPFVRASCGFPQMSLLRGQFFRYLKEFGKSC